MAAECSREPGLTDSLRVEGSVDGLALGARPELGPVEEGEMHSRTGCGGTDCQGIALPGRLSMSEPQTVRPSAKLHGLELVLLKTVTFEGHSTRR